MVVVGDSYASGNYYNAHHVLTHRRYPSSVTPVIKESPHRGTLAKSNENLLNPGLTHTPSVAYKTRHSHRPTGSGSTHGRTPTIVSSYVSPTVTRRPSIQQKKRFMMSKKELKSKFFYPVNGPKRVGSRRRGKYRSKSELDASMSYIDFDSSMSKDLCFNQYVAAYEFGSKDLLKPDPTPRERIKIITVDSKNNYILYTPDPSTGKNSIADAEKILNQELLKLGNPVIASEKPATPVLAQYRIIRPDYHRYDTFPMTERSSIVRTRSLPTKFNDAKTEALWNLYLRRVIAARIKWRLTNTSQDKLPEPKPEEQVLKSLSAASSVDTGFFVREKLQIQKAFPNAYKSSPISNEDLLTDNSSLSSDFYVQRPAPPPPSSSQEGVSRNSFDSSGSMVTALERSPARQIMLDSLEQLMAEVTSVVSSI